MAPDIPAVRRTEVRVPLMVLLVPLAPRSYDVRPIARPLVLPLRCTGFFSWIGPGRTKPGPMNVWSKFGKVLLVLVLSLSLGAHWALLQTVAWAGLFL